MPDEHLTSHTSAPPTSPSTTSHATSDPDTGPESSALPGPPDGRSETELERYDRNLTELMGELRVALPGVQVLFGFLLVIPFDARFKSATGAERGLYFATLVLTLVASMLLIAPTMIHRLMFSMGKKPLIVRLGNQLAIAGLSTLAVALTCAIAFVTAVVFGLVPAIATGILAAFGFVALWYLLPLTRV